MIDTLVLWLLALRIITMTIRSFSYRRPEHAAGRHSWRMKAIHKKSKLLRAPGAIPFQLFDRRVASPLPLTETKGLILTSEGTTVLSFAGTDPLNLANWVSDLNWLPRSGDFHTGFRIAADVVWDVVIAVEAATNAAKNLIITGHSLGAAIAPLIANRLQREKSQTASAVYVFGAPRAGGRGLVAEYGDLLVVSCLILDA